METLKKNRKLTQNAISYKKALFIFNRLPDTYNIPYC